jgi:Tol biopolymer transport system component
VIVRNDSLEIVKANGTAARPIPVPGIGVPQWPRWSPDGHVIRFTWTSIVPREGNRETLFEVRADGSGLRELPFSGEEGRADCCGVWTPDGSWYVYQSRYAGSHELRAVARSQSSSVSLTSGEVSYGAPVVSPDGTTLYALGWPTAGELVSFDTSRRAYVIEPSGVSGTWLSFSPNGDAMAYVSYPDKKLWRARIDGTGKQ